MSFISNIILRTLLLCTTPKPKGKFCMGVKGIERLEGITLFTEVALERKLVVYFALCYSRKRFFQKGFDLKFI